MSIEIWNVSETCKGDLDQTKLPTTCIQSVFRVKLENYTFQDSHHLINQVGVVLGEIQIKNNVIYKLTGYSVNFCQVIFIESNQKIIKTYLQFKKTSLTLYDT